MKPHTNNRADVGPEVADVVSPGEAVREAAPGLAREGHGVFRGTDRHPASLVSLALSHDASRQKRFVRLVDEHEPDIVALADRMAAGLSEPVHGRETEEGETDLVGACRRTLAWLYNHAHLAAGVASSAAPSPPGDGPPPWRCDTCSGLYTPWHVPERDWGRLPGALRPRSLCLGCFVPAYLASGGEPGQLAVSHEPWHRLQAVWPIRRRRRIHVVLYGKPRPGRVVDVVGVGRVLVRLLGPGAGAVVAVADWDGESRHPKTAVRCCGPPRPNRGSPRGDTRVRAAVDMDGAGPETSWPLLRATAGPSARCRTTGGWVSGGTSGCGQSPIRTPGMGPNPRLGLKPDPGPGVAADRRAGVLRGRTWPAPRPAGPLSAVRSPPVPRGIFIGRGAVPGLISSFWPGGGWHRFGGERVRARRAGSHRGKFSLVAAPRGTAPRASYRIQQLRRSRRCSPDRVGQAYPAEGGGRSRTTGGNGRFAGA